MNIIAKNDTGTWIGTCNGKIGHFKFISVEEMSSKSNSSVRTSYTSNTGSNEIASRNDNGTSSSIRPLTVTSNTSSSSHVVHADETDSLISSSQPNSSRAASVVHLSSCVTESGTKSETMITTAIRRKGSCCSTQSSNSSSVCGSSGGGQREGEDTDGQMRRRRRGGNNSDSLQSSSSCLPHPPLSGAMNTGMKSIPHPDGNCCYQSQSESRRVEGEGDHQDHDKDHEKNAVNSDAAAGVGISGGERPFSRIREFLIMKKQQLQLQLQQQQQQQMKQKPFHSDTGSNMTAAGISCNGRGVVTLFDASSLLTFISVGEFVDLVLSSSSYEGEAAVSEENGTSIKTPVGHEISRLLEGNGIPNLLVLTSRVSSPSGRERLHQLLSSSESLTGKGGERETAADLLLQSLDYVNDCVRRAAAGSGEQQQHHPQAVTCVTSNATPASSQIIKRQSGGRTCVTITSNIPATSSSIPAAPSSSSFYCCSSGVSRGGAGCEAIESHSSSCLTVSSSCPSLSQQQQQRQQQPGQGNGSESSAGVVSGGEKKTTAKKKEIPAARDQNLVTMNHVQQQQHQRKQSTASLSPSPCVAQNKTAAVNRLFLNLREGFSLSSSKSKNNNTIHSKNNANNNKKNNCNPSSHGHQRNRSSGGSESPNPYSIIPKSAPPTPSGVREPPAGSAGDEFANWFARKLNFFSSSSHAEYVFAFRFFQKQFKIPSYSYASLTSYQFLWKKDGEQKNLSINFSLLFHCSGTTNCTTPSPQPLTSFSPALSFSFPSKRISPENIYRPIVPTTTLVLQHPSLVRYFPPASPVDSLFSVHSLDFSPAPHPLTRHLL